jgi:hypothetical protein
MRGTLTTHREHATAGVTRSATAVNASSSERRIARASVGAAGA